MNRKEEIEQLKDSPLQSAYWHKAGWDDGVAHERKRSEILVEAINKSLTDGEQCDHCEGDGLVWADGKAHYQSYKGETMNCRDCGGSGQISVHVFDILKAGLQAYEREDIPEENKRMGCNHKGPICEA